ncbi:hypothetical protein TPHA_0B01890 [Tetrapisispora phaffii CBS 4417]|uniref:Acyl carrier protein n=1 Tax=Tetrapisispora phaffii (strain ATCC 24235 / CBS 4417 / NBRC 1672 / NRRL Y-8282 / UCD 70-5) TaxID=1071381 RepID=G8BPD0_TETPH|nr:hypothetical protein TPHA_0B01890 [Tetrapisispora phaffii CBS 4417]CCE61861.1 hypothetical protein TPHA_0B01890 [Tetrapisispora phaffii CBS 4417]
MFKNIFRTTASLATRSVVITTRPTYVAPSFIRLYSASALNKEDVTKRVVDVIRKFDKSLANSQIEPKSLFHKDLGLDSLDTVELLVAIEEEFDLQLPDKVADELKSVGETVDYIISNPEAN